MAMRKPGAYAPLSAFYADDDAIMAAGEDAELLYVRMLAYAARVPTAEGFISDSQLVSRLGIVPRMSGNGTGIEPGTDAGSRAAKLADVGLIEQVDGGWRITSWLKWNKSAAEMGREKKRDAERKKSVTSTDDGNGAGNGAGLRGANTETETETETRRAALARFEAFWKLYPKKVAKGDAEKAWASVVKTTDPDEIIDGLRERLPWFAEQLREKDYRPAAGPWLRQKRWLDEVGTRPAEQVLDWTHPDYIPKPYVFRDELEGGDAA